MMELGQNFKIVVNYIYPPIPDRRHDWCAYVDGWEEDGPYGWGATKFSALMDLIDMLEEQDG